MLELFKFIFSSFWIWLGAMGILYIVMIIVAIIIGGIISCTERGKNK